MLLSHNAHFRDINREVYWPGFPRDLAAVNVGDIVIKTGATTGFTTGRVDAVNLTIDVGPYPEGLGTARFVEQISTTAMSQGGDSGSLVCARNGATVGLLFAGSTTQSFINPIAPVLSLRPPEVGARSLLRLMPGDLVGQCAAVPGQVRRGGVEFLGEQFEGACHPRAVGAVEGDGDRLGGVVDLPALVEQVTGDGPVLVGVAEVGVETFGQPSFGVEREQPEHHLQPRRASWGRARPAAGSRSVTRAAW